MDIDIIEKILNGDKLTVAMLIRDVDDGIPKAFDHLKSLYQYTGRAHIIGITGSPGSGKSTLINSLISIFRKQNKTVGVIAVDPTSPCSGGALLGDRIRMQKHTSDPAVFIHSIATRGWSGGLSKTTSSIIHILDAMGKDIILVETVGIGQAEVDITHIADTTLLVLNPHSGDSIQMMKAGIIEVADIFVINKADQPDTDALKRSLQYFISLLSANENSWLPPVLLTEAVNDKGISELSDTIRNHKDWLISSNTLTRRRRERARLELFDIIKSYLLSSIKEILDLPEMDKIVEALSQNQSDPYSAAMEIVSRFTNNNNLKIFPKRQ